jgi:hypothetical protein
MKKLNIFFLSFSMLIVFFSVYSSAQDFSLKEDEALVWSGYFENQAFLQYRKDADDIAILDYNKLRIDMSFKASKTVTFNADIIFSTYHGATSFNLVNYLPENIFDQIPQEIAPYLTLDFEDDFYVNDAYLTVYLKGLSIRVGKQQIPWGTGYTWNPTDNFHRKDQLDPTYEKVGVNALKIEIPWGLDGSITAVAVNKEEVENFSYALKVKKNILGFDISASYQYLHEPRIDIMTLEPEEEMRQVAGFDFTGQLFDVGVWGEGTYSWPDKDSILNEEYGEYLLGMDYTFEGGLYLIGEYLHRDHGVKEKDKYFYEDFLRMIFGEITNIGTDYLMLGASYPITDLLTIQTYSIINLQDSSWIIIPWISYDAGQNLEIMGALNYFFGDDGTEYGEFGSGGFLRFRVYF